MNERILKTLLTAFDHTKGEIIGEIPMVKGLEKKEAAAILYLLWENVCESDIKEAFDIAICKYLNEIEEDANFSEDIEFEKELAELMTKSFRNNY